MATWQVWVTGLASVTTMMVLTWIVSLVRHDASIVDRVWGLGFVVAAWTYALAADTFTPRAWLVLTLVTLWGVRLAGYITWRNWGDGEDKRYRQMRERHPGSFQIRSLVTVFLLQGILAWFISLPLLAAVTYGEPSTLTWLDGVAVLIWLVGFVYEAGGDWQLARFLSDPSNRGKVMDRGLWRTTRHPNYFGDATVWWSYLVFALATGAWWTAVGPALMTLLIVKVSGVAMTERSMSSGGSTREGYEEYVRRTNAFIPGPRKD